MFADVSIVSGYSRVVALTEAWPLAARWPDFMPCMVTPPEFPGDRVLASPLTQTLGCEVALAGIWFVTNAARTSPGSQTPSTEGVRLAMLAGTGFGGFFVFIARTSDDAAFLPLVVCRAIGVVAAILLITARRMRLPSLTSSPTALVAGLLDASSGVFFVLAKEWTRFDVAAVLSSLYPVSTVLLARLIQNERITWRQWLGVSLCLVAVGLMTV